jgi:anti-sigma regulatory factor (Ser/Thr protein kinase)
METESSNRFPAEVNNLSSIRQFVEQVAEKLGADPDAIYDINLAVTEMVTNIILHGYQDQPGTIDVGVSREQDALIVRIHDRAPPFDPTDIPAPNFDLPLENRPMGGMGMFLTRELMDDVIYQEAPNGGNQLTLVKKYVAS